MDRDGGGKSKGQTWSTMDVCALGNLMAGRRERREKAEKSNIIYREREGGIFKAFFLFCSPAQKRGKSSAGGILWREGREGRLQAVKREGGGEIMGEIKCQNRAAAVGMTGQTRATLQYIHNTVQAQYRKGFRRGFYSFYHGEGGKKRDFCFVAAATAMIVYVFLPLFYAGYCTYCRVGKGVRRKKMVVVREKGDGFWEENDTCAVGRNEVEVVLVFLCVWASP